jgi:hypothetical protein
MTSGGNRYPAKAELLQLGAGRESRCRRELMCASLPDDVAGDQCNSARTTVSSSLGRRQADVRCLPGHCPFLFVRGPSADTTPGNTCCRVILWGPASAWTGQQDFQRRGWSDVVPASMCVTAGCTSPSRLADRSARAAVGNRRANAGTGRARPSGTARPGCGCLPHHSLTTLYRPRTGPRGVLTCEFSRAELVITARFSRTDLPPLSE